MENLEFFLNESSMEIESAPIGTPNGDTTDIAGTPDFTIETEDDNTSIEDDYELTPDVYEANYKFLTGSGYLMLPEDYEFEPNEEGWKKALEESNKNLQEVVVEDMFNRVDDKGRLLLNYFLSGGSDLDRFMDTLKFDDYNSLDLTNESHQRSVVEKLLRETTQFSKEEIADYIEDLDINNKLETKAKEAKDKLDGIKSQREKQLVEVGKQERDEEVKRVQKSMSDLAETIKANKNINGIPFTESDAKLVVDSFFKPIKQKDGSVTTSYETKYYAAMQDPKKAAILAKIIENDFDFSFIGRKQTTDATKEFKKQLTNAFTPKRGNPGTGGSTDGFNWDTANLIKI